MGCVFGVFWLQWLENEPNGGEKWPADLANFVITTLSVLCVLLTRLG
jgi:hypothetical protein